MVILTNKATNKIQDIQKEKNFKNIKANLDLCELKNRIVDNINQTLFYNEPFEYIKGYFS